MIRTLCAVVLATAVSASYIAPEASCWTETRKCRWEAKPDGYKCIDYYDGHYSRCHPLMKYKKVCDDAVTEPKKLSKAPASYCDWNMANSTLIGYSKNYIKGYPADGASKYYNTKKLPKHPKGFPAKPSPAPKKSIAPRTTPAAKAKPYKATVKQTTKSTVAPTAAPYKPTVTVSPKKITYKPTSKPTIKPTAAPYKPTSKRTVAPTTAPYKKTSKPTLAPTAATYKPTSKLTVAPTAAPYKPTSKPAVAPTAAPYNPTSKPTVASTAVAY